MAIKKISELGTQAFLGTSGVVSNSYVLINYAESANDTPVTYKTTIEELGQAMAEKLSFVMGSENGLYTLSVGQSAYNSISLDIGGGGGEAPSGANYIFESGNNYYIDSSGNHIGGDASALQNLIAAATIEGSTEYETYNFVVTDDSGTLYYMDNCGTSHELPYVVFADTSTDHCIHFTDSEDTQINILTTPYAQYKYPVVVSTDGNLYYYDDNDTEYKLVSSIS